jgi:hypothetical protein
MALAPTATDQTCVALAELEDAFGWLAGHGAGALAARLRRLGQFDRDGLVSHRAFRAVIEDADEAALQAARTLPGCFGCAPAHALRDTAAAVLARREAAS